MMPYAIASLSLNYTVSISSEPHQHHGAPLLCREHILLAPSALVKLSVPHLSFHYGWDLSPATKA